jgi:hypothetical protein
MLNLRQLNVESDALGSKADKSPLYIISQIKNRLFFPVLAGYNSHDERPWEDEASPSSRLFTPMGG